MKNPFLGGFFDRLNSESLKYAVLRNYQSLPGSTDGSDLDIFINKCDEHEFLKILLQESERCNGGIISVIDSKTCPRYCVMGFDQTFWGLMIDLHLENIIYRGHIIISKEIIWKNVNQINNIFALNRRTDALIGLFKELLNNGNCREKYYTDFINNSMDHKFLKEVFSDIRKNDISEFLSVFPEMGYCRESIKFLMTFLDNEFPKPFFSSIKKLSKIKRLTRKPGYAIVFLGTDGSGKSTLIENIKPLLEEAFHNSVYYEHLRPNYFRNLSGLSGKIQAVGPVKNPHEKDSSGFAGSLARLGYYLLDYTLGYYLKIFPKKAFKSCVWIFDRYYYDYYIDQRRSRINLPYWIVRLGQAFIPEPDLIFCLGADPGIIHSRKPELPLPEIERQMKALKKFALNHKRAVWINTGETVEKSCESALGEIQNVMFRRFKDLRFS